MSVMSPKLPRNGFTLIELLVVLVLLGLISSVVSPAIFKWMNSREANAKRTELQNVFNALPLQAIFTSTEIVIANASDIEAISGSSIVIEEPIVVTKNGFCLGGKFSARINNVVYEYAVEKPFCRITRI